MAKAARPVAGIPGRAGRAGDGREFDRARNGHDPGRHGQQKHVARDLGISEQSVSRAIIRSGWQEEWAARPAVEMLLATAHGLVLKAAASPEAPDRGER